MKVLHINIADTAGGAARAACRLNRGLHRAGVDSKMLVQFKRSDNRTVAGRTSNMGKGLARMRISLDHLPKLFYKKKTDRQFHLQWLPDRTLRRAVRMRPDIIHLHWICRGFINIKSLAGIDIPVVWTLHDMWPFTGGCHFSEACRRFEASCGACHQLGSGNARDLSSWTLGRKHIHFNLKNMTLIAPSRWMSNQARHSALFKNVSIQNIPNGIDTGMFRPIDRHTARELLHLPRNKKLILAGSLGGTADPRKGFQYLGRALRHFSATDIGEDAELVVIGASEPADSTGFNIKTTRLGTMKDDISLALAYSAADLFVAPSTQDNLPNMVMEALSCGTPCLAFDIGGMPDMVRHKKNGYLAEPLDAPGLADGMAYLLESGERLKEMGRRARLKVEREFDSMEIAKRHIGLYENIIKKRA